LSTSRVAGVIAKRRRAPTNAGREPGGCGVANAVEPIAIISHRAKGGISVMAKKTAKGGKKKGGKKR
jgi:hypothetical protein